MKIQGSILFVFVVANAWCMNNSTMQMVTVVPSLSSLTTNQKSSIATTDLNQMAKDFGEIFSITQVRPLDGKDSSEIVSYAKVRPPSRGHQRSKSRFCAQEMMRLSPDEVTNLLRQLDPQTKRKVENSIIFARLENVKDIKDANEVLDIFESKSSNILIVDGCGQGVLHHALKNKGDDSEATLYLIKNLLRLNALVDAQDSEKKTPLHLAAIDSTIEILNLLLQAKPQLDLQDVSGNTALHYAIQFGRLDIMEALVKAGARCDIPNNAQLTAMAMAKKRELAEKIEEALKEVAASNDRVIEITVNPTVQDAKTKNEVVVKQPKKRSWFWRYCCCCCCGDD